MGTKKNKAKELQIIEDYSEKSFAVVGNTKPLRKELALLGGAYNPRLTCGAGWVFSKKHRARVDDFIATGKVTK